MTEPAAFDPNNLKMQPLGPPEGLLDQFNLPPKLIAFIRRNQRLLWIMFVTVVLVSFGVAGFNAYRDYREQKAASAFDAAVLAPANNKALLEKVVADYATTDSALWAKIELAQQAERTGDATTAISNLESINGGVGHTSPLKPLLLGKLAAMYENANQLDKALRLYTELSAWESFAAEAYRGLGRVNEQLGKKTDAVAMYGKYLELANGEAEAAMNKPVREMVQARVNRLKQDQPQPQQ